MSLGFQRLFLIGLFVSPILGFLYGINGEETWVGLLGAFTSIFIYFIGWMLILWVIDGFKK